MQIPHTATKSIELILFFKYATVFYSQAFLMLLNCLMWHYSDAMEVVESMHF